MTLRIILSFVLLPVMLAQGQQRILDSLQKVYRQADLSTRIDLIKSFRNAGEKKENIEAMLNQLGREVEKIKVDSLHYKFIAREGDFLVFSSRGTEGIQKLVSALQYYEKNGPQKHAAEVAYRIGRYYFYTQEMKQSLKYIRLADRLYTGNDPAQKATYKMVMGILYQNMHRLDSALYYQDQSLALKEKNGLTTSLPISLNNIAELYLDLNNHPRAIQYIDRSIRLSDSLQLHDALAYAQHVKGKIYNKEKNYQEAIYWLLPASRFWENRKTYEDLQDSYYQLSTAYEGTGNYKRAFECLRLYKAVTDSLYNAEKLKIASETEAKYQNEKNELVIARQKAEKEKVESQKNVVEAQKRNQFTIFIVVAALLVVNILIFYSRYKKQKKDKELIALQKAQLEVRNKDIEDSISYSSKVQRSIFPSPQDFNASFSDSFIFFKPKEKVSGDFYWHERKGSLVLFAAADCTGHGVPGAMVSVVCSGALNRAVKEFGITDPGKILDKVRQLVVETFEKSETEVKDGMDISFCVLDTQTRVLYWAGANNPLWVIRKNAQEVEQVDANKQPIGKYSQAVPFTTHHLQLYTGDAFYVFTDGFADQFGGENGKKFKAAKMKKLLLEMKDLAMEKQKQSLTLAFEEWRGDLEQVDDVCVIGIRV